MPSSTTMPEAEEADDPSNVELAEEDGRFRNDNNNNADSVFSVVDDIVDGVVCVHRRHRVDDPFADAGQFTIPPLQTGAVPDSSKHAEALAGVLREALENDEEDVMFGDQKSKSKRRRPRAKAPSDSNRYTLRGGARGKGAKDDDNESRTVTVRGRVYILEGQRGDGNCLFRSLASGLGFKERRAYMAVRAAIVDHAAVNWSRFGHLAKKQHDVTTKKDYEFEMRKDRTWGDHSEIVLAADLYEVPIYVLNHNSDMFAVENPSGSLKEPIFLNYDFKRGHYDLLRPKVVEDKKDEEEEEKMDVESTP